MHRTFTRKNTESVTVVIDLCVYPSLNSVTEFFFDIGEDSYNHKWPYQSHCIWISGIFNRMNNLMNPILRTNVAKTPPLQKQLSSGIRTSMFVHNFYFILCRLNCMWIELPFPSWWLCFSYCVSHGFVRASSPVHYEQSTCKRWIGKVLTRWATLGYVARLTFAH